MKTKQVLGIAEVVVVVALTLGAIIGHELAMRLSICYLMGSQCGEAILRNFRTRP